MSFIISFIKIPACIFGCSVFTLPSKISLEFVKLETSKHLNFNFFIILNVPPELIILILFFLSILKVVLNFFI